MDETSFTIHPKNPLLGQEIEIQVNHNIEEEGTWIVQDETLLTIESYSKSIIIQPLLTGEYTVLYKIENNTYGKSFNVKIKKDKKESTNEEPVEEVKDIDIIETLLKVGSNYNLPHFIKRNARYRGHRESEKFLNSDQEQVFDIKMNYLELKKETEIISKAVKQWFDGESLDKDKNHLFSGETIYQATSDRTIYPITSRGEMSHFDYVVVKLNGEEIDKGFYQILGTSLDLDIKKGFNLDEANLSIEFRAVTQKGASTFRGLNYISKKTTELNEKLSELERRYMSHENAYK